MKSFNRFNSLSLRLSIVIALVMLGGVASVATLSAIQEFRQTINAETERLKSVATAFAATVSPALRANDQHAAFVALHGIRDLPNTTYAGVRYANGRPLAEIGSGTVLVGRDSRLDEASPLSFLTAKTIRTVIPVRSSGQVVGSLEIYSDIRWLRTRYVTALQRTLIQALLLAILTATAAFLAIKQLIRPLSRLSDELQAMGETPDLSKRFEIVRRDEIGVLANAFNSAFAAIEKRDLAIRKHRDTLEATVADRTRELHESMQVAQKANAAKSDFLATMSHEIRTPMNGMLVMAELLTASPLAPKHHRYAEVISRSGRTLLNIINDILDVSKIESGKLDLETIPFSIDELAADTVSLFSARAQEKGLSLGLDIGRDVAGRLFGDPTRLGQVIANLTNNAIKFTEDGGVFIRVRASGGAAASRQVICIEVVDTGIGIAADKIDHIFEAFAQADHSTSRQFGGTGLGLSISKKLVEAMDGTISARSEPGHGTTFRLEIELPVEEAAAARPSGSGRTVVLIAPDDIATMCADVMLSSAGFDVISGDGAADQVTRADVVLVHPAKAQDATQMQPRPGAPVILVRPAGDDAPVALPSGEPAGEIALPIGRETVDLLCTMANSGDFSVLVESECTGDLSRQLPDFSHASVLAVDDNAVNREVLGEALSALGVKASFACSGQQAIDLQLTDGFDIIFMDVSMPGMDGYEATRRIRSVRPAQGNSNPRIVALTAHVTGEQAERWRECGMDGYIAKPFTIDQLMREMSALTLPADSTETGGDDAAATIPPAEPEDDTDMSSDIPLISEASTAMFETVAKANGIDMRHRIFSMFAEHAPATEAELSSACESGADTVEIARLAHALKSMCTSAGAERAAAYCGMIEENANAGRVPGAPQRAALSAAIQATIDEMTRSTAGGAKPARAAG